MADSSLWKVRRQTQTLAEPARPPALLRVGWEAPARAASPASDLLLERSPAPAASESFRRREGPRRRGPSGREGGRKRRLQPRGPGSAWCPAPRSPVRRTLGRGRAEASSFFPAASSEIALPDCRGVPAPQPAMSRLLPLLSWTARNPEPGRRRRRRAPSALLVLRAGAARAAQPREEPRALGTHPRRSPWRR